MIANIFLPLLEWLASQTSAEAKDAPKFDFDTRGKPNDDAPTRFFIDSEIRLDVVQRICCALGGSTSPSLSVSELASQPHQYRGKATEGALGSLPGGGKAGYVYTRHGGFIDLGHVRDYIDYTRFFAARYLGAPLTGRGEANELSKLFSEKGDIHLIVAPRAKKPSAIQAVIVGAKLAYERALWHEIATYFPPQGLELNQQYSSFAPEDNFSNAIGILAGFHALLTPTVDFNTAADQALLSVLNALGSATKAETEAATDYVKGFWWNAEIFGTPTPKALRRNFDGIFLIKPWLVTDIAVPGEVAKALELRKALGRPRAATIEIPRQYDGLVLDTLAHLEITNVAPLINAIVPHLAAQGHIKSLDFRSVVESIRAKERAENPLRGNADSPGPPAP